MKKDKKIFFSLDSNVERDILNPFPKRFIDCTNPYFDYLVKFRATVKQLADFVPLRGKPEKFDNGGYGGPSYIRYDNGSIQVFAKIQKETVREFYINKERGLSVKAKEIYKQLLTDLENCLNIFRANSEVFTFDMSFLPKYHLNNKNWYQIVFDGLEIVFDTLKDELKPQPKQANKKESFKSTLSKLQKKKLFKALINNQYIDNTTKEIDFLAIFSGSLPDKYKPVQWIDKAITRHEPNAQTLFELLYLLNPYIEKKYYDTTATNESNFYRLINNCFVDVKNLSEKNPAKAISDTPRKTLLKSIVDTLQS